MTSSTWSDLTLGDFVRLQRGHDLPAAQQRMGSVPVMGSAGPNGLHDIAKAKGPGVTVGRSGVGSMGVVNYCPVDFWPHNTVLYVTDFMGNDERFAYYFLKQLDLKRYNSGSVQASLNRNFIYPISIRVPPIREQRRIVEILRSLDDKIELNRRMNETLEAMARRLFKSWFVDFDPVHAKAALRKKHSRWTNDRLSREALPNLDPKIAELFPDEMVDSELGMIPKGWRVGTVEDMTSLDKTTVKPAEHADEVFDHYSIPSFDKAKSPVQDAGSDIKSNKFSVTDEVVLLTKLNPRIRRVWLPYPCASCRSICSTEFLVLKHRSGFSREFLFSHVSSSTFFEVYETMVTGTSGSHQRIRPDHLLAMDATIPSEKVVDAFTSQVSKMLGQQNQLRQQSTVLASTRDKLLPKLLSGEMNTSRLNKLEVQ